jgi:hypothetical protein
MVSSVAFFGQWIGSNAEHANASVPTARHPKKRTFSTPSANSGSDCTNDGCGPGRFLAHVPADAKMIRTDAADEAARREVRRSMKPARRLCNEVKRRTYLSVANDLIGDMYLLGDKIKK